MSQTLSLADSRVILDELIQALAKQHLRFQFRKRFGTGELLTPELLKRGTVIAERGRPITNLLQETPPKVDCVLLTGTADEPSGRAWTVQSPGTVGELFSSEELEQALVVTGRTAKLFAYSDPTEDKVYVFRISIEPAYEEKAAKAKPRRVRSAGKATAKKSFAKAGRRR